MRGAYHGGVMTLGKDEREENIELALTLMFEDLGDDPSTQRVFVSNDPRYEGAVRRRLGKTSSAMTLCRWSLIPRAPTSIVDLRIEPRTSSMPFLNDYVTY
jgi:hypothetical protein